MRWTMLHVRWLMLTHGLNDRYSPEKQSLRSHIITPALHFYIYDFV